MVVPYGRVNFLGPGSGEVWAWTYLKKVGVKAIQE